MAAAVDLDAIALATSGAVGADLANMINEAERPLIYFGGGVVASDAGDELNELLEIADIPATYTLMAAGILVISTVVRMWTTHNTNT